jgi:hypothetical protein
VFIPDPASHRHAVADEPETTVLSFGGPANFEPSAWEWAFRAEAVKLSEPGRAREILHDGLRSHPEAGSLHYGLACLDALDGRHQDALARLRTAIGFDPGSGNGRARTPTSTRLWPIRSSALWSSTATDDPGAGIGS